MWCDKSEIPLSLGSQFKVIRSFLMRNLLFGNLNLVWMLRVHILDIHVAAISKSSPDLSEVLLQLFLCLLYFKLCAIICLVKSFDRLWDLLIKVHCLPLDKSLKFTDS
jgi:hypothetical protein